MSLVVTLVNLGFISGFILKWFKAWGFAFIVGFPIVAIVIPIVRKIISGITE
jgi:hypothetical protein